MPSRRKSFCVQSRPITLNTALQWHVVNLRFVDRLTNRCILLLQQGGRCGHCDLLTHCSERETYVDCQVILDVRLNAGTSKLTEAGGSNPQRIGARIHSLEDIITVRTGAHCLGYTCVAVCDRHSSSRNHRAARVRHPPDDSPARNLSKNA